MADGRKSWEDIVSEAELDEQAAEKLVKAELLRAVAKLSEERQTEKQTVTDLNVQIQQFQGNEATFQPKIINLETEKM